ncbi:hypothetical protein H5U98_17250 [Mycolicibacterium boenickei]|uniref:Uncharacterized protein n=1 Tax=Mycolicibacterium boenickei TaxID=146017 RepID=A0AAX2ZQA7_9MYCO|nr:hypothetical protein [Mycolicibacterium boenickei]UNB97359.1 hypothetical protein H5U98_17250 [Mycolicibacterium boenickei]
MTQPAQYRVLADVGGTVVAEQGPLVVVIDRGTGPLATTAFVLGVLAVVFGGFGAVTLGLALGGRGGGVPPVVSAVFLAAGLIFGAATAAAVGRIKADNRRPLTGYRPVAVLDRARGVLADADGVVLAPLSHVQFARRMQLGSSSPKLVAVTPSGDRILKRGNPFNGGIGNLDAVLTAALHGR